MTPSTTRRWIRATACCLLVLTACGSSNGDGEEDQAGDTTTTEAATEDLTVRLVAEIVGLGCTRTAPVGNGSQLVVLDADGTRIGVGEFQLSPGLVKGEDTCDWTATVDDLPADVGLVVLEGDRQELATVDPAEHDWAVELEATISGVRVAGS